jgi:hypothetical protein
VDQRTPSNAVWNYANRRTHGERRYVYDRRVLIRFESDRRYSRERRLDIDLDLDPWGIP